MISTEIRYYAAVPQENLFRTETLSRPVSPTAYGLGELRLISDLPLPGLMACPGDVRIGSTIVIRRAAVCELLSTVAATFPFGQCNEKELLLKIPGLAGTCFVTGMKSL